MTWLHPNRTSQGSFQAKIPMAQILTPDVWLEIAEIPAKTAAGITLSVGSGLVRSHGFAHVPGGVRRAAIGDHEQDQGKRRDRVIFQRFRLGFRKPHL
jgi:hypothetical protein